MNKVTAEVELQQTVLYLALADNELCSTIQKGLAAEYQSSYYKTIDDLLEAIKKQQPAIILCDNNLLLQQKDAALATIKMATAARILMIGPSQAIDKQVAVLRQGVRGYFDSSLPMGKLHEALYRVLHGEIWVELDVISDLIDELTQVPDISMEQRSQLSSLTPKEMDVAQQVSHGATNKIIAQKMNITERTVKAHLTAIFQKMAIPDRLSLAILFRDLR